MTSVVSVRGRPRRMPDSDLVRAALDLLLEIGPANLTFARLADRVSMVPASIAHRFGSRDKLMADISRELTARFVSLARDAATEPCRGIDSLVEFLVQLCRPAASPVSIINQISLMQIELASLQLRRDVADRSRAVRTALHILLTAAAARGELSCNDPDALAAALHDTQVGALLNWCVNPTGELRDRVERDVRFVLGPFVKGWANAMAADHQGLTAAEEEQKG